MNKKKPQLKKRLFTKMHIKISVLCLVCTLVALLLQTFLFQKTSSELIYRQSKDAIEYSLQNLQDDLYSFIKLMESGLIDIYKEGDFVRDLKNGADIETLRTKYYRTAYNLATGSFDPSDGVVALYLYDTEHQNISTYRRAVTPKHNYPTDIYADSAQYNADRVKEYIASDDAVTMVSSYYNRNREKDMIRFVLKIYHTTKRKQVIGYIVCDVDPKAVRKMMEKYYTDDASVIWIQPEGDRAVFQMGADEESRTQTLQEEIEAGASPDRELAERSENVFFRVGQRKYNLSAYALMPQSLLKENQRTLSRSLLLIAGIAILLAVLIAWFISKTLTKPLEEMTRTAKRIKAGETHLRLRNSQSDEIGELAVSFNEMLDQIEHLVGREYEAQLLLNQAKYNALQAQINPHFLYNTLDTMSSIADIRDCPEVSALSMSLANIFRYSLDMKNPFSTVAAEIVHLKNYIYVMDVRMQENVEYVFDVEDSILKSSMPRISIQPLVENALTHGLRGSRKKKRIVISAKKDGENLLISVEDNGIGIAEEERRELLNPEHKNHTKSIGLNNIHSRMKILYGPEYGVTIESRIGEGTKVSLLIPSVRMEEIELWKQKNTKS